MYTTTTTASKGIHIRSQTRTGTRILGPTAIPVPSTLLLFRSLATGRGGEGEGREGRESRRAGEGEGEGREEDREGREGREERKLRIPRMPRGFLPPRITSTSTSSTSSSPTPKSPSSSPSSYPTSRILSNLGSLISHASSPPPGWTYSPNTSPNSGAEFRRLAGTIPSIVRLRGESVEKMAFERRGNREDGLDELGLGGLGLGGGGGGVGGGEGDGGEGGGGELTLEPGTFVELRRSTIAVNAVVLAASYTSSSKTSSTSSTSPSSSSKTSPSSKTSSKTFSTPSKTSSSPSSKTSRTPGLTYLSLTSTGEVWPHTKDDVYFSVPGVVARDVVRMCGGEEEEDDVPEIATTKPQLHARVLVLKTLRQIQRDVEHAMNTLLSRQVDLYALTRAVNPEDWGETTLGEVGRVFGRRKKGGKNGNTTFAQVFAAHKYVVANPRWFVLAHDYATSRRIRVRPKGDVERLKWVEGVVRTHPHEMDEFISLCQSIISTSPPFLLSPPLSFTSTTERKRKWSPTAQVFIRHLIKSLKPQHPAQIDPYLLGVQYIVKKVYPEVDDVFDEVVHRLLVDIGAVAPWQDVTTLRAMSEGELFLGDPPTTTRRSSTPPSPNAPLGPEDFYPTDPAHHIRHDFGDLPVYVIDDTNAQELDDGISVEPLPSPSPSSTPSSKVWIHIHIADPTSLLPPTHALAKHAENMVESMYFVQGACPMLPRSFTHDARNGFSLGCTGGEQRTLTFSVLVDLGEGGEGGGGKEGGEIEEYMVRAGVVRNFVVASYAEVDQVLGFVPEKWEKPFAPPPPLNPPPPPPSPSPSPDLTHLQPHIPNLRALYTASQAFVARRFRDGVFTQSRPVSKLTGVVWPHTTPVVGFPVPSSENVPAHTYNGYPFFTSPPSSSLSSSSSSSSSSPLPYLSQYQTSAQHLLDTHSRSLVAECMKLASRACSMFCRDHSVPILRRWAEPPVLDSEEGLRRVVGARRGGGGYLVWGDQHHPKTHGEGGSGKENGYTILATHLLSDSTAGYTLDLRGHWGLGVPPHEGYVRCTSPLRRYADLVVHWQVKSALIGVDALHSHSSSLTSTSSPRNTPKIPPSLLPFSTPRLRAFATHNQAAERFRKRIAGQHEAWWGVAWLMRYLEVVQILEGGKKGERGGRYKFTASAVVRNDENNNGSGVGAGSGSLNLPSSLLSNSTSILQTNPFPTLTATLTSPPETNRDSKKLQAAVYLTRLGIKAVLTEEERGGVRGTPYNIADLRVGDTVPVEVNAMRLGVRPQVQVVPRRG